MTNELSLRGRTALVTGSGRNIGRSVLLELAAHGANVVVNSRSNRSQAEAVADEARALGVEALVVLGDAAEKATVERIRHEAGARFGAVDIYVSNAARRLYKSFFDTTDDDWRRYLDQQLTASWYLAKLLTPAMIQRRWGRIIHINGVDGWDGRWTRIPHSVGKGGLRTLTKSLASGLGEFGITVNDVAPGFTATERDPETHPEVTADYTAATIARIPIRRQPAPEEVAWAICFLCAQRSAAITGAVIHVDGGARMLG